MARFEKYSKKIVPHFPFGISDWLRRQCHFRLELPAKHHTSLFYTISLENPEMRCKISTYLLTGNTVQTSFTLREKAETPKKKATEKKNYLWIYKQKRFVLKTSVNQGNFGTIVFINV